MASRGPGTWPESNSNSMARGTAWFDGLAARDVIGHPVDVDQRGPIPHNGAELKQHVDALKQRIGVDMVHMVGHSKGGIDGRECVKHNDDVETLFMLAAPNAGSFLATAFLVSAGVLSVAVEFAKGQLHMSIPYMLGYNLHDVRNPVTRTSASLESICRILRCKCFATSDRTTTSSRNWPPIFRIPRSGSTPA